ncbi:MAG: hypothetical protein HXM78_03720 [Neisseria lactamica]|nr:hypothetical protein [uncultured Neisseria sp.]MBF1279559.1 hypothetical protein [Neisseria lactamica]
MNINEYLRDNLKRISEKTHIAPDIEEKKLNNAISSFKYPGSHNNVVAIYDNTVFGSCKTGLLFTGEQLILKEDFSDPQSIQYENIESVKLQEIVKDAAKNKIETQVLITSKEGKRIVLKSLLHSFNYHAFVDIFSKVVTDETQFEFKDEQQLVPIEDMPEKLKTAYVQCIANMAFANDNIIDEKELAEIFVLMSRINLQPESRSIIRSYMCNLDTLQPLEVLLSTIAENEPGGQIKNIHISLVKDLINTYISTTGIDGDITDESIKGFDFLNNNRHLFEVSNDDINIILSTINTDRKILNDELSDDEITTLLKDVSSKAAAVGVPIAAIYLSGSVMGLSAAGITSGLSALGLGGVFGLSGMVTGIGVAVLIGVAAHVGIRKLTGADEISKSKKRELMLNMVIRLTQKTIAQLIEDINYVTKELNQTMSNQDGLNEKIRHLTLYLQQLTSSGHVLNERNENVQKNVTKIRCAQYLDEEKLRQLTSEPTKKEYFNFIRDKYEEVEMINTKSEQKETIIKLRVKKDISQNDVEHLAAAFEAIGYFDATSVIKNKVKGLFGG